jgi:prophage regulatory protein
MIPTTKNGHATILPLRPPCKMLSMKEVARRLGFTDRTIWRWVKKGRFPQPLRFSAAAIRWRAEDIERIEREGLPSPEGGE